MSVRNLVRSQLGVFEFSADISARSSRGKQNPDFSYTYTSKYIFTCSVVIQGQCFQFQVLIRKSGGALELKDWLSVIWIRATPIRVQVPVLVWLRVPVPQRTITYGILWLACFMYDPVSWHHVNNSTTPCMGSRVVGKVSQTPLAWVCNVC